MESSGAHDRRLSLISNSRKVLAVALISILVFSTIIYAIPVKAQEAKDAPDTTASVDSEEDKRIRFKTREFVPTPGLQIQAIQRQAAAADSVHYLMQFESLPDQAQKESLAAQGINLIAYVTGNTYIASSTVSNVNNLADASGVAFAGPLSADDKISENLRNGNIGEWAITDTGLVVLAIQFHDDISIDDAVGIVESLGGEVIGVVPVTTTVIAAFDSSQVYGIAQEDSVQYVDMIEPPLGPTNDGARVAANVVPLAAAPFGLTGNGVTLLVYDTGLVDAAHPDFGARVIETEAGETLTDHSTHVAGTAGGSGVNSNGNDSNGNPNNGTPNQWAGMAPAVNIRSFGSMGPFGALGPHYDQSPGTNADFTTAITNGIDLATMSLGNNVVPNGLPCGQLGDYADIAILLDNIVTGSINNQQLIYFESAGNERQDPDGPGGTPPAPCGQFGTISSPATAKNTIAVGAINSNDNSITGFTSFGPTDDGRLKPDITAPGCQVGGDGGITSPSLFVDLNGNNNFDAGEPSNGYDVKCGTSMSTPVASGSAALLIEQWRNQFGAGTRPLPHTVKAIFVHTSTDLGNAGPDYRFGWGALNALAAVQLVVDDATANLINVDQVDQGNTDLYVFTSDGSADPTITLAWDDEPATRLAATTLINNLDLIVEDPDGVIYRPLVLNPAAPANVATPGNDATNNVEMVVGSAKAGNWLVRVSGTAVPMGPQEYTVITPDDATQVQDVGTIVIVKDSLPNDPQDFQFFSDEIPAFTFFLDDDGNNIGDPFAAPPSERPNQVVFSNLITKPLFPINYHVTELVPTGFDLTNLTCIDPDAQTTVNLNTATASIDLDEGETVTCTFENTKFGTIIINKDTIPDDPQDFRIDTTTQFPFVFLDDDGVEGNPLFSSATLSNIVPGTHTLTEPATPGFVLSALTCTDPDNGTTTDLNTATATVDMDPGETITCNFENTKLGTIVIVKDSIPNDPQDFEFNSNELPVSPFFLDDDGNNVGDPFAAPPSERPNQVTFNDLLPKPLVPNNYDVTELVPSGFVLSNLTCVSDDPNDTTATNLNTATASIDLDPGETVTCTYEDTKLGTIIINKDTQPSPNAQDFTYLSNRPAAIPNFSLDDDNDPTLPSTRTFDNLLPNTLLPGPYIIREVPNIDFLTTVTCVEDATANTTTVGLRAIINLDPGETVECTFTNALDIVKTIHAEKEVLVDLTSGIIKEVTVYIEIHENLNRLRPGVPLQDPVVLKQVEVVTCEKKIDEATVLSCETSTPPEDTDMIDRVQNCVDEPIPFTPEMNTISKSSASNSAGMNTVVSGLRHAVVKTIDAQKEVFVCEQGTKIQDVVIFTEIFENLNSLPRNPVILKQYEVVTCLKDAATLTVESCVFGPTTRLFP